MIDAGVAWVFEAYGSLSARGQVALVFALAAVFAVASPSMARRAGRRSVGVVGWLAPRAGRAASGASRRVASTGVRVLPVAGRAAAGGVRRVAGASVRTVGVVGRGAASRVDLRGNSRHRLVAFVGACFVVGFLAGLAGPPIGELGGVVVSGVSGWVP